MTAMKHKSIDARRQRHTRLRRACEPLLKRFACTQMQLASRVDAMLRENEALKATVVQLKQEVKDAKR